MISDLEIFEQIKSKAKHNEAYLGGDFEYKETNGRIKFLKIHHYDFKVFPEEIFELNSIVELDLEIGIGSVYSFFQVFPDNFDRLVNLKILKLRSNQINKFPLSICKLTNLVELDMSFNSLTSLPVELIKLTNLEKLDIGYNIYGYDPIEIAKNMDNVTYNNSNLSNGQLALIGKLGNLKQLHLGKTIVTTIEPLLNCRSLEKLDLGNCKFGNIPRDINNLQNLVKINLYNCDLGEIPSTFGDLTKLESLELGNNKLKVFPENLGSLNKIEYLGLNENEIEVFPSFISEQQKLINLNLSENKIKIIPDEIMNLIELTDLNIKDNEIKSISNNISFLKKIDSMNIQNNKLTSLPDGFCELFNLAYLSAADNKIERLPENFHKLNKLWRIDFDYNELSELPSLFGNLPLLSSLSFRKNKFTEIPSEIGFLEELKYDGKLSFSDNPLNPEELEILEYPIKRIKEYCRKKSSIRIFFSHAMADYAEYQHQELLTLLNKDPVIDKIYSCENDLIGNIDQFMKTYIPQSQLMIFFATEKSVKNSSDCEFEIKLAQELHIPIIPIKCNDVSWQDLANLGIDRELGFEFNGDLEIFSKDLIDYICLLKKKVDLFKREAVEVDTISFMTEMILDRYFRSEKYKERIFNKKQEINSLIHLIEDETIDTEEFLIKIGTLIEFERKEEVPSENDN